MYKKSYPAPHLFALGYQICLIDFVSFFSGVQLSGVISLG